MKFIVRIHISSSFLFLILSFLFFANSSFAETKTFIKEYTYHAGDEDSRNSSRTIALREVKRLLLEELGTYLESQTEVKNFQMTKDKIATLTAGIVSTEVIEDKWDGKVYWLKAKIVANPQDVIKSVDSLRKDRAKVQELEELRKRSEELLKENERLSKELKTARGKEKQEAVQAYKRNIDNLNASEWFDRGVGLNIDGNFTDAIKAFSMVIELNPRATIAYGAYVDRGVAYEMLGNYQQAIKDYNKAIELNPKYEMAYSSRGVAHAMLGNYQQAIKDYSKAIELNPHDATAYYNRGVNYDRIGNYKQAIKDYSKAIELNPQNANAYYNRGVVYSSLINYQHAIEDYGKAIEIDPQIAPAYYNRGIAYANLGNGLQTIKDFIIAARLGHKEAQEFLRSHNIEW
jgi:tetratricopeptide (TPR) repeat protein